jgi:WD40 repeat protein
MLTDVNSGATLWRKQIADGVLSDLALTEDGSGALCAGPHGEVFLLNTADGVISQTYQVSPGLRTTAVAIGPAGDSFAAGAVDGHVRVVSLRTGEVVADLGQRPWPVMSVAFSHADGFLYAADVTSISVYNWRTPEEVRHFQSPDGAFWFTSAAFSPREDRVFIGSYFAASAIDLVTGETRREYAGHEAGIVRARLYDDRKELVTLARDMRLRTFDLDSGALKTEFFLSRTFIPAMADAAIDEASSRIALATYEFDIFHWTSRPYLRTFRYDR